MKGNDRRIEEPNKIARLSNKAISSLLSSPFALPKRNRRVKMIMISKVIFIPLLHPSFCGHDSRVNHKNKKDQGIRAVWCNVWSRKGGRVVNINSVNQMSSFMASLSFIRSLWFSLRKKRKRTIGLVPSKWFPCPKRGRNVEIHSCWKMFLFHFYYIPLPTFWCSIFMWWNRM